MNIALVEAIPVEEMITTKFNRLPLKEALTRLITNYAYVTNSAKDTGRITKIIRGKGVARGVSVAEPFKFDFDPRK